MPTFSCVRRPCVILAVLCIAVMFPAAVWAREYMSKVQCVAYDLAERYDFSAYKGLVFGFFDPSLKLSFVVSFCDQIQVMDGDVDELDLAADRYSTNVQGVMNEFLIERYQPKDTNITFDFNDERTWNINNVANFRMRFNKGSNGPPCNLELSRKAGNTMHAPKYGGRQAEINYYCDGCPEWPADWKTTGGIRKYCTKYKNQLGNWGRPRTIDPITAAPTDVRDGNACICGVKALPIVDIRGKVQANCMYTFNITGSCVVPTEGFNDVKRLHALVVCASIIVFIFLVATAREQRQRSLKTGKPFALLDSIQSARNAMGGRNGIGRLKSLVKSSDLIPPPPETD